MILNQATYPSPIGEILVYATDDTVVGLEFTDRGRRVSTLRRHLQHALGAFETREAADPAGAITRLARYFEGDPGALESQPVAYHGTDFQNTVWRALRRIAPGRTMSYGGLALAVGAAGAARAVGAANGSNPISLFVPCHRVIAADGTLHGYGGGLHRKEWLLAHEGARPAGLALVTRTAERELVR